MTSKPTQQYASFDQAYDFFNAELFGGTLPLVLITLQRKNKCDGYFAPQRFTTRTLEGKESTDELAMNPDNFTGRTDKEILSTLAHEMTHVKQQHMGKPGRGGYHNGEWANMMLEIGLTPYSVDKPGTMTGQKVTHTIDEGGRFDRVCDQLIETGWLLEWQSYQPEPGEKKKPVSKVKYTCPECEANAWAKPGSKLICGECHEADESIFIMTAPDTEGDGDNEDE